MTFLKVAGICLSLLTSWAASCLAQSISSEVVEAFDFGASAPSLAGAHVVEVRDNHALCRQASEAEAKLMNERDPHLELRLIDRGSRRAMAERAVTGLNISFRATPQLDSYPQAKAAILRAAARWEAVIRDPITVVIDVDFGPTRFGTPYPSPDTLGSTQSDIRTGPYTPAALAMLLRSPSTLLYQLLPATSVPTDLGSATTLAAPSASLRMLGLLPQAADGTGPNPSIGFNSAYLFDFDPSDGITTNGSDFDAVVTHEIGHLLGFASVVGNLELHPSNPVTVSSWDLFRFRPGISVGTFTNDARILSSGGDQVFFDGLHQVPLSTGRADGSGGDDHQASHWKDDELTGIYIGLMDPTLTDGVRGSMTVWDLDTLSWLGYNISPASFNQAHMTSLSPGAVTAGGPGFQLTVDGSLFRHGAVVYWKGVPRQTAFVSATRVTANISTADLASGGEASIEVVNPGAIPSNTLVVSITTSCRRCTRVVPFRPVRP